MPIKIARDLAGRLTSGKRLDQLRASKALLEKLQLAEVDAVSADLKRLEIDWAAPPKDFANAPKPGDFEVVVKTDRPNDTG
jgi:hypothetical protein